MVLLQGTQRDAQRHSEIWVPLLANADRSIVTPAAGPPNGDHRMPRRGQAGAIRESVFLSYILTAVKINALAGPLTFIEVAFRNPDSFLELPHSVFFPHPQVPAVRHGSSVHI